MTSVSNGGMIFGGGGPNEVDGFEDEAGDWAREPFLS